jgi:hypothetical protein
MKKFILMLGIAVLPFVFSSCDPNDDPEDIITDVTGVVNLNIDGQNIEIKAATFSVLNGRITMVASNGSNSVMMYVDATATGEYTLGICKNLTLAEITNAIGGIAEIVSGGGNYLLYTPSSGAQENSKIILVGSVNFSTLSSSKIEGTLTGTAVSYSEAMDLASNPVGLLSLLTGSGTQINGTFKANHLPIGK